MWSETVPLGDLATGRALDPLAARGVGLVAAVRPWDLDRLPALGAACAERGVALSIWPMIADADGRWLSLRTARLWLDLARAAVERLARTPPQEVAFDLEPPIALARALLLRPDRGLAAFVRPTAPRGPAAPWSPFVDELAARGVASAAVVLPPLLARGWGERAWGRVLGTPVRGARWSRVDVMMYTSLLEGWSRGVVSRRRAVAWLFRACRRARAKHGERASVSVGAVGVGALGSEPVYRGPEELAEDVAAARAAGVDDLTLLDLGGVLARPPASAWLDALVE